MNKKITLSILFLILLLAQPCIANSQKLTIGIVDYPPHIDLSSPLEQSPLVNYFSNILLQHGFEPNYISLPGERANIELIKGNIDLLLPSDYQNQSTTILSQPIFHAIPGLCFQKKNFIPILSATHRLHDLTVGIPNGVTPLPIIEKSGAILVPLKGSNATLRGIDLTQRGRISAFYHPSPNKVYHSKNKSYKALACSYFHGYSTPIFIGTSPQLNKLVFNKLNKAYLQAMKQESYEFYLAQLTANADL